MEDNQQLPDSQENQSQEEGPLTTEASSQPPVEEIGIDLNVLFPDADKDLNALFPDDESRQLLKKINKNKKDLHTLNERFQFENEETDSEGSTTP
ncbi:MAG: hypothetical protein COV66_10085 [Nitrospinae bacterium CG11_big_fil_rev_8_21_14_0_20_45_15]|nr:MAG: hypothetical protein COV66_10085 [Nitrospinae bacterium CG11_big_fil_rev_8_21_14_0_20_45_15]